MPVQARTGDRTLDLDRRGDVVLVDGQPAEVHMARVGSHTVHLLVEGRSHVVTLEPLAGGRVRATIGGRTIEVETRDARALLLERFGFAEAEAAAERALRAPMPGLVVRVLVEPGQAVEAGEGLVVLEAMKMENELKAPAAGTVAAIHARPGAAVGKNDLLVELT